jgi:hypothetical protein
LTIGAPVRLPVEDTKRCPDPAQPPGLALNVSRYGDSPVTATHEPSIAVIGGLAGTQTRAVTVNGRSLEISPRGGFLAVVAGDQPVEIVAIGRDGRRKKFLR